MQTNTRGEDANTKADQGNARTRQRVSKTSSKPVEAESETGDSISLTASGDSISLTASGNQPLTHYELGRPASRALRRYITAVQVAQSEMFCYCSLSKLTQRHGVLSLKDKEFSREMKGKGPLYPGRQEVQVHRPQMDFGGSLALCGSGTEERSG